jgi:hypothetical protein
MGGMNWLRIGLVAGSCKCSNEPSSGSIKCGQFLAEDRLVSQEGLCSMELVRNYEFYSRRTNRFLNTLLNFQNMKMYGQGTTFNKITKA